MNFIIKQTQICRRLHENVKQNFVLIREPSTVSGIYKLITHVGKTSFIVDAPRREHASTVRTFENIKTIATM